MSTSTEESVKLICVKYKSSDSPGKVKMKLLRAMRRAERQSRSPNTAIIHPLQPWTNHCHTIGDLPADDVLITLSNSRYIVFLTKDGRVCRLKCTSRPELSQKGSSAIASLLSSLRRGNSTTHGLSFQEESDAEYARQLQAEYEAQSHRSLTSGGGAALGHLPTFFGRAGSPSTVLEELDREARVYSTYLGIPPPWSSEASSYRVRPPFSLRDNSPVMIGAFGRDTVVLGAADARSGDSPPPDYSSLFGDRRSSGGPPVQLLGGEGGRAGGQGQSARGKVLWPEMGTLEWLVCKQNPDNASQDNKFVAMAVLHSEILLVSAESRQLYSWSCSDHTHSSSRRPVLVPHPLNEELGLSSERIALLESSDVRATVVTETGKVVTFYDALLRVSVDEAAPSLVQSLTHPAQVFPELEGETITQLSVSNFITTAVTSTGKVFWWGLCPKDKDTTSNNTSSSNQNPRTSGGHRPIPSTSRSRSRGAIIDGSLVRLKNGPPCGPNSIVYSRSPGGPRVGKTMNIIEHGSLDPKTSVLVKVFKDDYRVNSDDNKKPSWMDLDSRLLPELDTNSNYNSLEVWKLSDVVFLDDSPAILGRVVTVDHPQAIVDISHSTSESGTLASSSNAKSTLKVFKVSELELCPIDYGENGSQSQPQSRQQQQQQKANLASTSGFSEAKVLQNHGGVSHHVAGTVQHHPVCILSPELTSSSGNVSSSSLLQQQGSATGSVIYGYTPLAVHTTDEGPTLLVERMSDSATFLVYSGHSSAGSGALISTSFMALNCKDSKPNLFTIEEESVPALEGGFRADPVVLSYNRPTNDDQPLTGGNGKDAQKGSDGARSKDTLGSKVTKGKSKANAASTPVKSVEVDAVVGATKSSISPRRSSRKRKLDKNSKTPATTPNKLQASDDTSDKQTACTSAAAKSLKKVDPSSQLLQSSATLPCPPVAKLNSQPLLIWDVNGMVCPLLDGLNLKSVPGKTSLPLPTMSYRFVTSRQHAITKSQNVYILTLVCRAQSLMPAVQSGNVLKVDAILNSLKGDQTTNKETGDDESARQDSRQSKLHPPKPAEASEEDDDSPVAKRQKLSTPAPPKQAGDQNEQVEGSSKRSSERLKSLSDVPSEISFEAEIPILEKSITTCTTTSTAPHLRSSDEKPLSTAQETESSSSDVYANEKVDSLGIFFETTVHNSNVLHVCCQFDDSGGGGGGAKAGKAAADSSSLRIPSWLKPVSGSPEMSFEESRHSYIFSRKREKGERKSRSVKELQSMSLCERKLEILDLLLSCEQIQPIVVKLLSSRNADGETPFMTSICSQNYAAALRILDYLEEWSVSQRNHHGQQQQESEFFKKSILSPWRNGATPIQALLASLSPFYDIKSMCLYVYNLPMSYTAQHLLKLFQLRYPSAFKAEIIKRDLDREDEGVESSGDEDGETDGWSSGDDDGEGGEDDEGEGESRQRPGGVGGGRGRESNLLSGLRAAVRRRHRGYRRRTAYGLGGGVSSLHPRQGIVHFSNVVELRSAAKEMNDYRMITAISRTTGFGHTQSIHYLNVQLESLSDSDDDDDPTERGLGISSFAFDDFHPLSRYSRYGNDSLRSNHRGSGLGGSRRKSSKGKTGTARELSSPILAFQLLQKLLSYQQLVTARDSAGETALSSLVHNPKCLQSLKDLQKSLNSKDEDESSPENRSQLPGGRTSISTSGIGGSSSNLGMPTTSSGRPIRSFTTLAELMKSQEEETKTALNIDRSVPTSSSSPSTTTNPMGSRGPPVMPYVSLADWLDQFFSTIQGTSLEGNLPKFLTETQQMLQNSSGSSVSESNNDGAPKTEEEKGECSFSKPQEVATSTPKPKVVGQVSAGGSSDLSETVRKKANALLAAAKERKEERERKGELPLPFQILKATAPFVKKSSKKTADVGTSTSKASSESSTDDQTDVPKSKRLRLGPAKILSDSKSSTKLPNLSFGPSETNLLEESGTRTSSEKAETPCGEEQQGNETGEQATENDVDIGAQILEALVTNWPGIVATVLGFYLPCMIKLTNRTSTPEDKGHSNTCDASQENMECLSCPTSSATLEFSTVHSVDSFVTNLVLNCEDTTVDMIVAAIVERMNEAVFNSTDPENQVDLSLLSESVDFTKLPEEVCVLNEHNTALLVGVRFMNSVVRLLGLEHSRVKNAFVEMQQLRQSNAAMEGRGRVDRDRSSIGRLMAEGPSTFMDYDRSLGAGGGGGGRGRRNTAPRKNITATVKRILGQFSWLAVHSLSEAAEASSAPVRIGVSKPLGASSVLPEYQGGGRSSYGSHVYSLPLNSHSSSSMWSLARQIHIRTPQSLQAKRRRNERRETQQSCSALPADGIILRPYPKDYDGSEGETGLGGGAASTVMGGASIHDESFEDEFSDMEGSVTDGNADIPSTSRATADHITPNFVTELSLPPEVTGEIFLDLDPSSSDDDSIIEFPPDSVLHGTHGQGGTTEGDNIDDIYPFAWALDGRRIGESSDAGARPTSPTGGSLFIANSEQTVPLTSIPSIRFGAGFLARTFARFVKDLVDVAKDIADQKAPQCCLKLPPEILSMLMNSTVVAMEKTWQWVASVLDVAEGQLRQGQYFETQRHVVSLRSGSTRNHSSSRPGQVARVSRSFIGSTPGEYITYLLRTHAREDRDCLPVLDLYGYEHIVYMLDGLIYTLNNWPKAVVTATLNSSQSEANEFSIFEPTNQTATSDSSKLESHQMEIDDNSRNTSRTESQCRFFHRTESVTITTGDDPEILRHNEQFFGTDGTATTLALEQPELAGPPTPWRGAQDGRFSQPLNEAYPLAQKPHLLKPFAKKEHLFSSSMSSEGSSELERGEEKGDRPRLSVSYSNPVTSTPVGPITMSWSVDEIQQRWHSAISVFAHIFLAEGPGSERSNFLNAKAGFASRMARFRHLVQQLYDASQLTRDWAGTVSSTLAIRVRRDHLLLDSIDLLKQLVRFHYSTTRVKFDGEDGSGPGVNRGFFASLANELKSSDLTKQPMNRLGQFFCEPGKKPEQSGLYAPCPFFKSGLSLSTRHTVMSQRKAAFQAIGRYLGLCLWFRYTIPFMVCRHVAKFFLGRELAWHDLAFYNADLYEGLRRMMLDAEEGKKDQDEFVATYCCYFEAPLGGQNGDSKLVELIPGGSKIPVTQQRVREYVRLYAMFLMVECVREELQAMKDGLNDVIPAELLSGLTAEDFQLLLSGGSADINLSRLKSVIRFNHTHGNSTIVCDRFEKMFWRVVTHMTNVQRQQLLYFATGSATLPASADSNNRNPAVAITIDVISSSSIDSLPVASTCSQRMSIPLYPSYQLLKKKLLQAVQCQAYGLG